MSILMVNVYSEEVCAITKSVDFKSRHPELKILLNFTVSVSVFVYDSIPVFCGRCEN